MKLLRLRRLKPRPKNVNRGRLRAQVVAMSPVKTIRLTYRQDHVGGFERNQIGTLTLIPKGAYYVESVNLSPGFTVLWAVIGGQYFYFDRRGQTSIPPSRLWPARTPIGVKFRRVASQGFTPGATFQAQVLEVVA